MAKSEFLARMSDQLRTPLKSIVGFAEIIGDRSLGDSAWEQYAEYAHDIQDSGSILLEMINDILDISKIEAGKYVLKPELVDLSQVVAELSHQFEDSCAEKGIVIGHERSEEPVEAFADPRAVRQILTNLLSNAVKFTPADGRISVSVQTAPDSVTLAVADTGFGIAESDVPRILIPFEQVQRGKAPSEQQGAGLGLAISSSLAEMQGGTLRIDSTEGSGTTVFVTFPTAGQTH